MCEQMENPLVPESYSVLVGAARALGKGGPVRWPKATGLQLARGSQLAVILCSSDVSLLQGLSNSQNSHFSPLLSFSLLLR